MSRTPVTFTKKNYYTNFRKRHPETQIAPELHSHILKEAGGVMGDLLLKEGSLKMGSRLGDILIRKFIPRGKGSNFAVFTLPHESKMQGKAVYEFNDHTGGYIYRFLWNKRKCKGITDKNMWVFKPLRPLKRQLAFILKNNLNDFPIGTEHIEA
jgi:hypothetical protein